MKHSLNKRLVSSILAFFALILISNFHISSAEASYSEVTLGSAANFAILAGTAITNGESATVSGDASRSSGMAPTTATAGIVTSLFTSGSLTFENNDTASVTAQADLLTAINFMDLLTPTTTTAGIINQTLIPGVYRSDGATTFSVDGTIILDGQGDTQSVFIIHAGSALNISANTIVQLKGGAQSSNVYWVAGSELNVGADSTIYGNVISRSATTIGARSTVFGSLLTAGALTIGANVATTHMLLIKTEPTPPPDTSTPLPPPPRNYFSPSPPLIPTPIIATILEPVATPTPEVVIPTVVITPPPIPVEVHIPITAKVIAPTLVAPTQVAVQTPSSVITSPSIKITRAITRSSFRTYKPIDHPGSTSDTTVLAFATLTVISAGAGSLKSTSGNQQGYLAQVGRGGVIATGIQLGRGDQRRKRRVKNPGKLVNFFTAIATNLSILSPLAARTISDGNYLRAGFGNMSLAIYPFGAVVGILGALSVHMQALPPSTAFMVFLMGIGIVDAMAGFLASALFSLCVIATGHVGNLQSFLTLAGIVLIGYSPGILAGVFRPFRRTVDNTRALWERASDYILASILTGWVVKQIAAGLPGLSGLQLPIADHAHQLGVIAGIFVALRFFGEDIAHYFFPQKLADLEPEYRQRHTQQITLTALMQIFVFGLVAEPFIGWMPELWIGLALFALPLFFALKADKFPKSQFLGRWLPTGIIEMITMTVAGFYIAALLQNHISNPARYILISFVILGIPGFILKVLPLFASEYESTWKKSFKGNIAYRVLGSVALGALIYIVFSGLLVSNSL
jgi:hypothetical protein